MPMAQVMNGNDEAPTRSLMPEDRHGQLLELVAELLQANQELRFEVAQLEGKAERAADAVEESATVYRLLLP
jgi:hypothetical protein